MNNKGKGEGFATTAATQIDTDTINPKMQSETATDKGFEVANSRRRHLDIFRTSSNSQGQLRRRQWRPIQFLIEQGAKI